ncbi:MAG: adenylate/guanylate cyclase domain-containing protein [Myxococcales bacterium]|nr:adenylate/guanylate cyclase domain-containing protein [Myxococcales bacterium]MCB9706993.1 adenylate/guanylate cyclase domain-containing protein [Myxococcales bacterium]
MSFTDDLTAEVIKILKESWTTREGRHVPDTPDLKLSNDAITLTGTVLYADLAESTQLVNTYKPSFAAEIYKCYLNCACRIIRQQGGEITAFDGDRVMAVFLGDYKNTSAVRSALAINHAVVRIINQKIREAYPKISEDFAVRQAVGVDTSELFVARTGIRGSNDLVWVGRAANFAAKLCSLRQADYASWITADVYQACHESVKKADNGSSMWEQRSWTAQGGMTIYRSSWYWNL